MNNCFFLSVSLILKYHNIRIVKFTISSSLLIILTSSILLNPFNAVNTNSEGIGRDLMNLVALLIRTSKLSSSYSLWSNSPVTNSLSLLIFCILFSSFASSWSYNLNNTIKFTNLKSLSASKLTFFKYLGRSYGSISSGNSAVKISPK